MGSTYKKNIFSEGVQQGMLAWARRHKTSESSLGTKTKSQVAKMVKESSKMVSKTVAGLGGSGGDNNGDEESNQENSASSESEKNEGEKEESRDGDSLLVANHTELELAHLPRLSRRLLIALSMSRSRDGVEDGDGDEKDGEEKGGKIEEEEVEDGGEISEEKYSRFGKT